MAEPPERKLFSYLIKTSSNERTRLKYGLMSFMIPFTKSHHQSGSHLEECLSTNSLYNLQIGSSHPKVRNRSPHHPGWCGGASTLLCSSGVEAGGTRCNGTRLVLLGQGSLWSFLLLSPWSSGGSNICNFDHCKSRFRSFGLGRGKKKTV